eukprot:GHVN01085653.1.p1 GENE.GHVN01085653.1~~GHVN01085653.1.p1  ORF type:complete len:269 (+),score=61.84 GHVN01085653.1:111-917(+)
MSKAINVLLINGRKRFAHSQGFYNDLMHNTAKECFEKGLPSVKFVVSETIIEEGYEVEAEVKKMSEADIIVLQWPVWWMGLPWSTKKYLDDVLTAGHGSLYKSDGRTRSDPSKIYGSGGGCKAAYMLSVTSNCPTAAYSNVKDFYCGDSMDEAWVAVHRTFQFCGMTPLPTFACNDVMKVPKSETDVTRYRAHITKTIIPLFHSNYDEVVKMMNARREEMKGGEDPYKICAFQINSIVDKASPVGKAMSAQMERQMKEREAMSEVRGA